MKNRILFLIIFFIVGIILVFFITEPKKEKWIYNLPNNYVIKKESDTNIYLGKIINNKLTTTKNDKKIGILDYIAEFCYGKNYVGLKTLNTKKDNIDVLFYIVDTQNENIYGPYYDYETYEKVKEKIVDEQLNDWIETITKPKDAINK